MRRKRKFVLTILGCVTALLFPLLAESQCHSSPDLSIMDRDFLHYLKKDTGATHHGVALLPFFQNPTGRADPVFSVGIPFFIFDTLETASPEILHPYWGLEAATKLGLKGEDLSLVASAQQVAEELNVPFVVFGSYQITHKNSIRVILNLYNHRSQKAKSPALTFETPLNDSFFPELNKATVTLFKNDKSSPKIKVSDTLPPSLLAFREYVQGLTQAQHYNQNKLTLAEAWLKKAWSGSLKKYDAASIELARVYFMQGLLNKLQKKDFAPQWFKAHQLIRDLPFDLTTESQKQRLLKRFADFENLSIQATGTFLKNELKETSYFTRQALTLVPEDGMMQNLYLKSVQGKVDQGVSTDNAVCF